MSLDQDEKYAVAITFNARKRDDAPRTINGWIDLETAREMKRESKEKQPSAAVYIVMRLEEE